MYNFNLYLVTKMNQRDSKYCLTCTVSEWVRLITFIILYVVCLTAHFEAVSVW